MLKADAVRIFGSPAELARALEITRSAVSQWPDELDREKTDRVIGAAVRLGKPISITVTPAEPAAG